MSSEENNMKPTDANKIILLYIRSAFNLLEYKKMVQSLAESFINFFINIFYEFIGGIESDNIICVFYEN